MSLSVSTAYFPHVRVLGCNNKSNLVWSPFFINNSAGDTPVVDWGVIQYERGIVSSHARRVPFFQATLHYVHYTLC